MTPLQKNRQQRGGLCCHLVKAGGGGTGFHHGFTTSKNFTLFQHQINLFAVLTIYASFKSCQSLPLTFLHKPVKGSFNSPQASTLIRPKSTYTTNLSERDYLRGKKQKKMCFLPFGRVLRKGMMGELFNYHPFPDVYTVRSLVSDNLRSQIWKEACLCQCLPHAATMGPPA